MTIPRDTDHYELTTHGWNKAKQRNISGDYIKRTIRNGWVEVSARGEPCYRFIHDFGGEKSVGVIANIQTGEILTVFWNTKFEAPREKQ